MVEFLPDALDAWVGNFREGSGRYTGVHAVPGGQYVVVFAKGQGYVIDPKRRASTGEFGGDFHYVWEVQDPFGFVCDRQQLAFFRIGLGSVRWHTRRLSWDGFREVSFAPDRLSGLAWEPADVWLPFEVDVTTGASRGGAYPNPIPEGWLDEDWERLATVEPGTQ